MCRTKAIALAGCFLILWGTAAGCKTSKETGFLDIHTRILIHESDVGAGKNLKVSVVDKRRSNVILDKDSDRKIKSGRALVTKNFHPSLKLDTHFQTTATEAFQMQGYKMDGKGTGSVRELTIFITKLDLKVRKQKMVSEDQPPYQARIRTQIKISAKNRGMSFSNEYEFFIKKSYFQPPQKFDKEKMINYGLSQLLYQVLEDPKLNKFLIG